MGNPKGFIKIKREKQIYRPVCERVEDYREVAVPRNERLAQDQASRCMDCGTPFCHAACPLGNFIPEWNDLMYNGRWESALKLLYSTNNLPEVTGRVCPALCEFACVLGINDDPITIRENELSIIEYGYKNGLIMPHPPKKRSGKHVAIVGSGPSGIACADQLNKAGHVVHVFEKDDRLGGIMRYGIPDFKLDKGILDRKINILKQEGIEFKTGANIGRNYKPADLLSRFDAVCLAGGSRIPRDLCIEGRGLKGIHFAMEYLAQSNRRVAGDKIPEDKVIDAKGKRVVVIGGGDTGSDCVGTAHRQGAKCVVQIEIMPKPADCRTCDFPWPLYPPILKTTSSHEEGGERKWSIATKEFKGHDARVKSLVCEQNGDEFEIEADLVFLCLGFLGPDKEGLLKELGLELDNRGNIKTDNSYMTSKQGIFSAGDMRRGQSLIVWAISEGRRAAYNIDKYLMGSSSLPLI